MLGSATQADEALAREGPHCLPRQRGVLLLRVGSLLHARPSALSAMAVPARWRRAAGPGAPLEPQSLVACGASRPADRRLAQGGTLDCPGGPGVDRWTERPGAPPVRGKGTIPPSLLRSLIEPSFGLSRGQQALSKGGLRGSLS